MLKHAYQTKLLPPSVLIPAIGLARIDEAVDFLIELIRNKYENIAQLAYEETESYSDADYEKTRQVFLNRF